jgi:hypothetical protein
MRENRPLRNFGNSVPLLREKRELTHNFPTDRDVVTSLPKVGRVVRRKGMPSFSALLLKVRMSAASTKRLEVARRVHKDTKLLRLSIVGVPLS